MKSIISETEEIRNLPYEPGAWSSRGLYLMQIGFPELAVGDAYKATLLLDEIHNETSIGSTALLMFGMKQWLSMNPSSRNAAPTDENFRVDVWAVLKIVEIKNTKLLIESLIRLDCLCDAQEVCRDAARKFPADGSFRGEKLAELNHWKRTVLARPMPSHSKPELKDDWIAAIRCGSFYRRAYPWMTSEMLRRDPSAIGKMQEKIKCLKAKCNVKKITDRDSLDATETDCYGMFATKNIKRGEIILQEGTVLCTSRLSTERCPACCKFLPTTPHFSECCRTPYCNAHCANLAATTFHASVCKRDFSSLHETVKPDASNMIILQEQVRVFALIIQEKASHPLTSTFLAPLHAQLGPKNTMAMCLRGTIIPTIKILRAFDIDIFADEKWDTWVLFIILARLANNQRAEEISHGGFIMAINPAYSFFNHSCDPNAQYGGPADDSSVTIIALKPIAKGEEIGISYLDSDNRKLGLRERQKLLTPWVGEQCFCQKCKVERDTLT